MAFIRDSTWLLIIMSSLLPVIAVNRCGLEAWELLPQGAQVPTRVKTTTPASHSAAVPEVLDWRFLNGTGFTTRVGTQMLPGPCGSCWAFASTGALSDRVKIATGGHLPDFNLAPQGLLDCGRIHLFGISAGSCNGGNPTLAYEFIAETGLTDETCMPYRSVDNANWGESDCADRMCRRCDRFGTCQFLPRNETTRVFVEEHGVVRGVAAMQAEIAARGPIACLMYAHAPAFENYTGGVISDGTRYKGTTHVIVVTGWGTDEHGVKHWVVRNSFGTQWGELGYYRQEMGKDIYNMESSDCSWATPTRDSVHQLQVRSGMTPEALGSVLV